MAPRYHSEKPKDKPVTYFEDVVKWQRLMGQPVGPPLKLLSEGEGHYAHQALRINPATRNDHSIALGVKLVKEEYSELIDGLEHENLENIADGAADLVWVVCGLMARLGIDLDEVWEGVKKANYAKVGGPIRADGKLLKPPGWKPPNTLQDVVNGRVIETLFLEKEK